MTTPSSRMARCALLALALVHPGGALTNISPRNAAGSVAARRAFGEEIASRVAARGAAPDAPGAVPRELGALRGGKGDKTPLKTPQTSSPPPSHKEPVARLRFKEPLPSRGERLRSALAARSGALARAARGRPAQLGASAAAALAIGTFIARQSILARLSLPPAPRRARRAP
jgi:hypothetical protein